VSSPERKNSAGRVIQTGYSLKGFAAFCHDLRTDAGTPMELEAFQRTMLTDYFAGAAETVIIIPKGNGKTTLLAALALYHLENTPSPKVLMVAASRDQARTMFDQAAGLIRESGLEDSRFVIKGGYGKIWLPGGDSTGPRIEVRPAEAATGDGAIFTLALVDELHRHRDLGLYTVLRKGTKKRQGRMVTITTAGAAMDSPLGQVRSEFHKKPGFRRDHRRKHNYVRDGAAVLHEWCLDAGDDPDDLKTVKVANPASFVTLKDLSDERHSPSYNPWDWRRLTCCLWTEGENPWLEPRVWDGLVEEGVAIPEGSDVWMGVDVGLLEQDSAVVAVWRRDDGRYVAEAVILKPPNSITEVENAVRATAARFQPRRIAYDNSGNFRRSGEVLFEDGLPMYEYPHSEQRMAEASATLLRVVQEGNLVHDGDGAFRAHVLAGATKQFERGWRLVKDPKTRRSVGALIAMARAVVVAEMEQDTEPLFAFG
jgi:phage terminase large subunit-like protein